MTHAPVEMHKRNHNAKHLMRAFASDKHSHIVKKIRHDANGHLRGVIELTKLLESRQKDDDNTREMLRLIRTGGEHAKRLVSGVTSYVEFFSAPMTSVSVNADHLIQEVVSLTKQHYTASFYHVNAGVIGDIIGDNAMIKAMFSEIISNAFHYHDRLSISRDIDIRSVQEDGHIYIDISDNGIGINPDHYERVFIMTERLHTHESYAGAGVGLTTAKLIAKRHGGDMMFIKPHHGFYTTLRVIWPCG